jgi:hypothetical protein
LSHLLAWLVCFMATCMHNYRDLVDTVAQTANVYAWKVSLVTSVLSVLQTMDPATSQTRHVTGMRLAMVMADAQETDHVNATAGLAAVSVIRVSRTNIAAPVKGTSRAIGLRLAVDMAGVCQGGTIPANVITASQGRHAISVLGKKLVQSASSLATEKLTATTGESVTNTMAAAFATQGIQESHAMPAPLAYMERNAPMQLSVIQISHAMQAGAADQTLLANVSQSSIAQL